MRYIQGTDWRVEGANAVTLGKFDGMHRGHQVLLQKLESLRTEGIGTAVFTFGTSPYELLRGESQILMTNEEKQAFCRAEGADVLIEYPFTDEVCHMPPEEFIRRVLVEQLHARYVIVGTDFCFGYRRQGSVALLKQLEAKYGYETFAMEKLRDETGREISSTYIKEELARGNMEKVQALSGYTYSVSAEIVHGRQFGRTYGIPTINTIPDPVKLLPPNGVYVSRVYLEQGVFGGVTNIGVRPTVSDEGKINLETFLFDFNEEIYGETARVELLHFVRPERRFASLLELETQIKADSETARNCLKQ